MFLIRPLKVTEIDALKRLHDRVYNKHVSRDYLRWLFRNPLGVVPMSCWYGDELVGFYCGEMRKLHRYRTAILTVAMTDPDYRKKGVFVELAKATYRELEKRGCSFIFLFANKNIVHIYDKYLGFEPIQLKKFWYDMDGEVAVLSYNEFIRLDGSHDFFKLYRFFEHPTKKYEYYMDKQHLHKVIFNVYQDQLQLIDFTTITDRVMDLAKMKAALNSCRYITCWNNAKPSEEWRSELIETWLCYKHFDARVPSQKSYILSKLRMGLSDVY